LSHGGHGNEFSEQEKTGSSEVRIEAGTAQRLGAKVLLLTTVALPNLAIAPMELSL
jgi:hypothetical protein